MKQSRTVKLLRLKVKMLQRELARARSEPVEDVLPTDPWIERLLTDNLCEEAILRVLCLHYPHGLLRSQIAQRTGYKKTAGFFQSAMQNLIEKRRISDGPVHTLVTK